MPPKLTVPGVYIEEITSGSHTIPDAPPPVTAFIGWSPQGPTDDAGSIGSWSDYVRMYGGLHVDSVLGYAVSLFFANGGQHAWIVRLALDDGGTGPGSPLMPDTPAFWQALFPTTLPDGEEQLTGGIYHLEGVESFDLLCVPGLTDPVI